VRGWQEPPDASALRGGAVPGHGALE